MGRVGLEPTTTRESVRTSTCQRATDPLKVTRKKYRLREDGHDPSSSYSASATSAGSETSGLMPSDGCSARLVTGRDGFLWFPLLFLFVFLFVCLALWVFLKCSGICLVCHSGEEQPMCCVVVDHRVQALLVSELVPSPCLPLLDVLLRLPAQPMTKPPPIGSRQRVGASPRECE